MSQKAYTVIFNTAILKDFYPRITNLHGKIYDNLENFKILGIDLATDQKKGVNLNTYLNNCINKGYSKLWILRRLVEHGVSIENLLLTYTSRVRVCVEENVPLWMFSVSREMETRIEKLQKISLFIILGKHAHRDYSRNLALLNLEQLDVRRQQIAINFARKILKHPEHRKMFNIINSNRTRSGKKVVVPTSRTTRYEKSTIPSLAKLINEKLADKI